MTGPSAHQHGHPAPPARLERDGTYARRTESAIRDMILSGAIKPGERLNEVALAEALGISRGPLREAIQRLVGEGLVTAVSHRGAYVRTFERREVEELYDLRTAMEMYVVRLVCANATDAQLAELAGLVRQAEKAISAKPGAAFPAEHDLHLHLITLADNPTLARATLEAQAQISLARQVSAQKPARAREAQHEHAELVAAITRRDEDQAARLMRLHLDQARRSAVEALGIDDDASTNSTRTRK